MSRVEIPRPPLREPWLAGFQDAAYRGGSKERRPALEPAVGAYDAGHLIGTTVAAANPHRRYLLSKGYRGRLTKPETGPVLVLPDIDDAKPKKTPRGLRKR